MRVRDAIRRGVVNPPSTKGFMARNTLYGADVFAARSAGSATYRNGLISSSSLTDVATVTRATTAWGFNQAGVLSSFAVDQPVVTTAGLAVWEARTNLAIRSQELDLWTTLNASVVANATTAPDGTLTADKIVEDTTATVQHGVYRAFATTAGQTYTTSFFAKAAERSWFFMTEGNNVTAQASFNLANGTLGTVSGTGSPSATITPLGNGWYRCSLTFTPISTTANIQARASSANGGANYTGDGVSGIYAWGGQAELGASASPYIPTTTAPVTCNADVITEAVNIPVGQAFTVLGKIIAPTAAAMAATSPTVFDLGPPSGSADRIELYANASGLRVWASSSGFGTASAGVPITAQGPVGFAISVSGNTVTYSFNGAASQSLIIPGGPLAQALSRLQCGCDLSGGLQLNSTLRDLSLVMRAYSAAELAAASDVSLVWDEDFTTQTYRYVGDPYAAITDLPMTTFTRATTKYAANSAGVLVPFAAGVPAATDAGLSVEAAATNILQNSGLGGGATPTNWAVGFETGTGSVGTSAVIPSNANRTCTVGVGNRQFITQTISLAANTTYTVSIYVEAFSGTPGDYMAYGASLPAGASATFLAPPTSTGRKTFTITTAGTAGTAQIRIGLGTSGGVTGAGSVTWSNPQVEAGAAATSIITTPVGGTATRNADVLVTADSVISPTVVAEFTTPSLTNYRTIFAHIGTSSTDAVLIYSNGTQIIARVNVGGIAQAVLTLGSIVPNTVYKVAFRVVANDFAASLNGAVCVVDGAGTLPTVTTAYIGVENSSVNPWGAGIRKIKRYSVAKTNAELQALATL